MSIWSRITDALAALRTGESLFDVFDRLRTPPERTVGFTIAVIALGAKMAKADGQVTRDEVTAFREIFHIPKSEESAAARVFDMARTDVAGFETYARRIARLFGDDRPDAREGHPLSDLLEGLFHIALADGRYHPRENAFLERVATIFGFEERAFLRMRARFVPDAERDPYEVLGADPSMSVDEIRRVWRGLVRDSHPDRMIARGVPEEAVKLAEKRLIAINRAWEQVLDRHAA